MKLIPRMAIPMAAAMLIASAGGGTRAVIFSRSTP